MCSTDEPVNMPLFQPGHLTPRDSESTLEIGDIAPNFSLPAISGESVELYDLLKDHVVVLTFVPAAFTPVCSKQWPGYNLAESYFEEANAVLLGITTDNLPTLYAWVEQMGGLWFPVLSDFYPHGKAASQYGILRSNGISERALFVIDQSRVIRYIDVHDINARPPLEDLVQAIQKVSP